MRRRFWRARRFNRLDPLTTPPLTDPLSLHRYVYVHGDPITGVDPAGLEFTLSGLMANIGNYVSLASRGLNAAHHAYKMYNTLQHVLEILDVVSTAGKFVGTFATTTAAGGSLLQAFQTAIQAALNVNVANLASFNGAMTDAFNFIGDKWDQVRTRLMANIDHVAIDVALDPGLKTTMLSHAMKGTKVALVINLPSPPYPGMWANITLPEINIRGFRIVLRSAKFLGRLFAFEFSASKTSIENILRVDYQDFHYGTHKFDLHYHVGNNPAPKNL